MTVAAAFGGLLPKPLPLVLAPLLGAGGAVSPVGCAGVYGQQGSNDACARRQGKQQEDSQRASSSSQATDDRRSPPSATALRGRALLKLLLGAAAAAAALQCCMDAPLPLETPAALAEGWWRRRAERRAAAALHPGASGPVRSRAVCMAAALVLLMIHKVVGTAVAWFSGAVCVRHEVHYRSDLEERAL